MKTAPNPCFFSFHIQHCHQRDRRATRTHPHLIPPPPPHAFTLTLLRASSLFSPCPLLPHPHFFEPPSPPFADGASLPCSAWPAAAAPSCCVWCVPLQPRSPRPPHRSPFAMLPTPLTPNSCAPAPPPAPHPSTPFPFPLLPRPQPRPARTCSNLPRRRLLTVPPSPAALGLLLPLIWPGQFLTVLETRL